jgi:hypothetical protein
MLVRVLAGVQEWRSGGSLGLHVSSADVTAARAAVRLAVGQLMQAVPAAVDDLLALTAKVCRG